MRDGSTPPIMRVASPADAEQLVAGVLAAMSELEAVLQAETDHVRVGRFREGLSQEARKTELAGSYMKGLEAIKANAVALARFAPDAVERLKAAHVAFGQVVQDNQTVLATARAVSESLVKGIADEMNRHARPQGYGPATGPAPQRAAGGSPLVLSRSL
jgi:hypothetical protein